MGQTFPPAMARKPGDPLHNIWPDVPSMASPLTGPVITASSNEGDVALDLFCIYVASQNLGRQWIGIDSSPDAVELVNMHQQESMGDVFHNRLVTVRTDITRRTDVDAPVSYRQSKHVLFGQ